MNGENGRVRSVALTWSTPRRECSNTTTQLTATSTGGWSDGTRESMTDGQDERVLWRRFKEGFNEDTSFSGRAGFVIGVLLSPLYEVYCRVR